MHAGSLALNPMAVPDIDRVERDTEDAIRAAQIARRKAKDEASSLRSILAFISQDMRAGGFPVTPSSLGGPPEEDDDE